MPTISLGSGLKFAGESILKVVRYGETLKTGIHVNFSRPGGTRNCDGSPKFE